MGNPEASCMGLGKPAECGRAVRLAATEASVAARSSETWAKGVNLD